jgi:hypothetical protein
MDENGYSIIFTPPFTPEVQPIELIWALIKGDVARKATINRSILKTREQTEEAFKLATPDQCHKNIEHCHKYIDDFIKEEDKSGHLHQFGSFAALIHSNHRPGQPIEVDLEPPIEQE